MLSLKKFFLFGLLLIYTILTIVNFYLTKNPYSALHSGKILNGTSTSFYISNIYILLISLLIILSRKSKFIINNSSYWIIILLSLMIFSGILNKRIVEKPLTYIYDFLMILLTYIFSINLKLTLKEVKLINKLCIFIIFLGLALVFLFNNKYGSIPFEFSRDSRGEVTLWKVGFIYTLYPTIFLFLLINKEIKKIQALVFLVTYIITLSTMSRIDIFLLTLPFIIYLILIIRNRNRNICFFFMILIIYFLKDKAMLFISGSSNLQHLSLDKISNGRLELWNYYYKNFLNHPFIGNGVFLLEKTNNYKGVAKSEIGYLKWLAEYGIFYTAILTIFLIKATKKAICSVKNKKNKEDLFFSILFLSLLIRVPESYSRILDINDFLFWLSLFYLNFKSIRR